MNTTERLAFRLVIAEPNTDERTITVCPRYDGLKLKWSRPSGQMYYTEDISGTVKFLGVDFQTINACALNTQFTFIVYQNRVEVGRSIFKKTDCKWDIDHGVVEVDVSVYDKYKKFQDKKDDEYNLVKMGIDKHRLNMYVYPQNQIYFQDDTILSLFASTAPGAQAPVSQYHTMNDLSAKMHFDLAVICGSLSWVLGSTGSSNSSFKFSIDDIWSSQTNITVQSRTYRCMRVGGGTMYDIFLGFGEPSLTHIAFIVVKYGQDAPQLYRSDIEFGIDDMYSKTSISFSLYGLGGTITCRLYAVFGGIVSYVNTWDTTKIPSDDITSGITNNYKGRFMISRSYIKNHVAVSNRTSSEPTEYGMVEGTSLYYNTPDDTQKWLPVRKDSWFDGYSAWVGDCVVERPTYWDYYRGVTYVPDFYLLTDAIRAVAQKIDEDIQFDSLDSQFLFNSLNPLNGIQQGALYISQKSNILNLGYDYPAWLAPVKWSQIETLLREAFDCYWSLYDRDGQKHLRIEHRRWYENGGNYTQQGVQVATIDLTSTYRNRTPFTFGERTRHWEFDTDGNGTVSTASRHEYGWMDTQSEIFDGQPITVPEAYRLFTDEKVEQHKVDWFSSDIDFLTSVQAECSSDGFVVVMENPNQPNWIVTGAAEYGGQNYQLSFDYLQDKYLLQGIYAEVVMIGDNEMQTNSNARMRTSEVQLRSVDGMEINASDTIKTAVGIGVIDTLEYDLHSQLYTVKLRYENE